ncbi:hypothetical protein D9M68_626820 [compost metagenome]
MEVALLRRLFELRREQVQHRLRVVALDQQHGAQQAQFGGYPRRFRVGVREERIEGQLGVVQAVAGQFGPADRQQQFDLLAP